MDSRNGEHEQSDETGKEDAGTDDEDAGRIGRKDRRSISRRWVVTVVANGKKEIMEISIDPAVVDPDDIEMLQDLIMAAANEALRKAERWCKAK